MAQPGEDSDMPVPDDAEVTNAPSFERLPLENFDIEDNPGSHMADGFVKRPRTSSSNFWSRLLRMTVRKRPQKFGTSDGVEEDDGLLDSDSNGHAFVVKKKDGRGSHRWMTSLWRLVAGVCVCWTLYTLLSMFLLRPHDNDPLANWGKPGTTSEGLDWYPTDFLRDVLPIPCHSHNDYWRTVPLFSALYAGCISVESDVWSFGTETLYVGHNTASLTANRTFQSLYINPLVRILERQNPRTEFYEDNTHGVFDTNHEQGLTLLVDVKTTGATTWPMVVEQLQPLRERGWLTYVENDVLHPGPITVVGTGETPFDVLTSNQTYRDAFFDSPLDTMWGASDPAVSEKNQNFAEEGNANPSKKAQLQTSAQGSAGTSPSDNYTPLNSYYASTSFAETVGMVWWGRLSSKQLDLIRGRIKGAHEKGLKVRYWDTPYWPRSLRNYIWDTLINEGVDILNVDDLESAKKGIW